MPLRANVAQRQQILPAQLPLERERVVLRIRCDVVGGESRIAADRQELREVAVRITLLNGDERKALAIGYTVYAVDEGSFKHGRRRRKVKLQERRLAKTVELLQVLHCRVEQSIGGPDTRFAWASGNLLQKSTGR